MSKPVQDYKSFAAISKAEKGMVRQNARLYAQELLRLALVLLVSVLVSSVSYAQPVPPGAWAGWDQDNPITSGGTVGGGTLGGGHNITGTGANRAYILTVDGYMTLGNNAGAGTVSNLAGLLVNGQLGSTQSLYLTGTSSIANVNTVRVNGGLYNLGSITGGNSDTAGRTGGILDVSGHLQNRRTIDSIAYITNYATINAGNGLTNTGEIVSNGSMTIDVTGDMVNGTGLDYAHDTSIISTNHYQYAPNDIDLTVSGGLTNWHDGQIQADYGEIAVAGTFYNQGSLSVTGEHYFTLESRNYWTILAGSFVNDGRTHEQFQHSRTSLGKEPVMMQDTNAQVSDVVIRTTGDFWNIGANAVINAAVETNQGKSLHVGGNFYNQDRASIFNFGEIIVDGSLHNKGATLVGGHWYSHSNLTVNYEHPMRYQSGIINVWRNVTNTTENAVGDHNYGGLIASFDTFRVNGSMYNDQYSTITGSYAHKGTDVGAGTPDYVSGVIMVPDPDADPEDPDAPMIPMPVDTEIFGRRANVINGILRDGFHSDAASVLNVMGLFENSESMPGETPFQGLYNEGHIREIDIIYVGADEAGVLVNTATSRDISNPNNTLPTSGGTNANDEGEVNPSGTITDIGILKTANLINDGQIFDIDEVIDVSYSLVNSKTGVLDGTGEYLDPAHIPTHVQWTYVNGLPVDRMEVESTVRPDLNVGESTATNTIIPQMGLTDAAGLPVAVGVGIINDGVIANFEQVFSKGTMYHGMASPSVDPLAAPTAIISDVTSVTVGSSITDDERADLHSAGAFVNVENLNVTGTLNLYTGSSFANVGTVTANDNVFVNGTINGGFTILSAKNGTLSIGSDSVLGLSLASLTIDSAAVASGDTAINYGSVINDGLLSSQTSIVNEGTIENNGTINAGSDFRNFGDISGRGMIYVGKNNTGKFANMTGGTMTGGVVVNGNFENLGGTITLGAVGDVIRVTNGTASISGGMVDASAYQNAVVGGQYLFLTTDPRTDANGLSSAGNLRFTGQELRAGANGNASGSTGTVLDFAPLHGTWDGTKYVAREVWEKNQYYWLEVQRAYQYGSAGVSENQTAVGQYLDTIGATVKQDNSVAVAAAVKQGQSASGIDTHTGLWNLFAQLDGISDDPTNPLYNPDYSDHQGAVNPAAQRALDELGGSVYSSVMLASVHNTGVVNTTIADTLRSDVFKFSFIGNPNNAIRGQAIAPLRYNRWGTLFGTGGSSQHDGNASGYRQSLGGVMAGIDRAFWTGTRLGAYLAVGGGEVSLKELDERTKTVDIMIGMYLRQEMYFGYGLAIGGFGHDTYKTERNLISLGHKAESRTHAAIGSMYLERGIDIPVYYATIQPFTSFQAITVNMDDFTESMRNQYGNTASVGLEGVQGRTSSFKLGLGARASSQPVPLPWGQLALTANMAWYHDFAGKQDRDFITRFTNPGGSNYGTQYNDVTFRVYGNDPKQDWINLGFGLHLDRNSTRFFLDTNLYTNSRQTLFTGNGGIVTSW